MLCRPVQGYTAIGLPARNNLTQLYFSEPFGTMKANLYAGATAAQNPSRDQYADSWRAKTHLYSRYIIQTRLR